MGKMTKILKKAHESGYAGVATKSGRSYKQYGCLRCRKNTAIKLVHILESKAALACVCGWRKKVNV
jgi:hypothetical protein